MGGRVGGWVRWAWEIHTYIVRERREGNAHGRAHVEEKRIVPLREIGSDNGKTVKQHEMYPMFCTFSCMLFIPFSPHLNHYIQICLTRFVFNIQREYEHSKDRKLHILGDNNEHVYGEYVEQLYESRYRY